MKKVKWQKRKMFYKLLSSSCALFIIPFATIIIMFFATRATIRDEILANAANSMDSFVYSMDLTFSELKNVVTQVSMNSTVNSYASRSNLENAAYGTGMYQVQKTLKGYAATGLEDLLVYFHGSDLIASQSKACLRTQLFYQSYFAKTQGSTGYFASCDAMMQWLEENEQNTSRPVLTSFVDQSGICHLAVSYARRLSDSTVFTVIALVKSHTIAQILDSASEKSERIMLLYDQNGRQVASSSNSEITNVTTDRLMEGVYQTIEADGTEYLLMKFSSTALDCTYVCAVQSLVVLKKLTWITNICIFGTGLCLFFSILSAIWLSKWNYRPIESLISTFSQKTGLHDSKPVIDEIGFINLVLNQSIEQCHRLEKRQESEILSIQESFWLHALQGLALVDQNNDDLFKSAGIHLRSDAFGVILVNVDYASPELTDDLEDSTSRKIIGLIVENVLTELCGQKHSGYVVRLSARQFAAVLNFSNEGTTEECSRDMQEICVLFSDFSKEKCGLGVTLAWSEINHGLTGIHSCFLQAKTAMRYRFIEGEGSLISYGSVIDRRFRYNSASGAYFAQVLLQYVRADAQRESELNLDSLLRYAMEDTQPSLETVNCYKFDMIGSVNKIILEIDAGSLNSENCLLEKLFSSDTLEHFQLQLADTMYQLRTFFLQSNERSNLCSKVREYIEANYMNAELNNSIIADAFHISPGYLSKLFRLQNSVSMMDFLNQRRISYAKQLLRDRDRNINEIAASTGFLSGSALIKAFKKQEGITPGSYRKLILSSDHVR